MKTWFYFLVGFISIAVDQLTKWWVSQHPVFLIENSGIVFGWGKNGGIFILVSICLILGLFLLTIEKPWKLLWPITLIFAGAVSNLIDRIFRGGVIDFIRIKDDIAFNVADIYIIIGLIIYAIVFYKYETKVFRHK